MSISVAKTTLEVVSANAPGIQVLKTTLDVVSSRTDGMRIAKTTLDVVSSSPPVVVVGIGRKQVLMGSI